MQQHCNSCVWSKPIELTICAILCNDCGHSKRKGKEGSVVKGRPSIKGPGGEHKEGSSNNYLSLRRIFNRASWGNCFLRFIVLFQLAAGDYILVRFIFLQVANYHGRCSCILFTPSFSFLFQFTLLLIFSILVSSSMNR